MTDNKARSFVTIMIVIALTALALRFGIGRILGMTIAQNESYASVTLKLISSALENYAKDNKVYPTNFSALVASTPAYLDKNYLQQSPLKGYFYSCARLDPAGYSCSAVPVRCRFTGSAVFTITNGGNLESRECDMRDE